MTAGATGIRAMWSKPSAVLMPLHDRGGDQWDADDDAKGGETHCCKVARLRSQLSCGAEAVPL